MIRRNLQERLAKFERWCGCALCRCANAEVEMKEKKDRVDDALVRNACRYRGRYHSGWRCWHISALIEGFGRLWKGANADETTGINIVKRAIEEPLRQIVENAGWRRFGGCRESTPGLKATSVTMPVRTNTRDMKARRYRRPGQGRLVWLWRMPLLLPACS